MGPKGYRICWVGNRPERMRSVLGEAETVGEVHFLAYPGTERAQLREVHPSLLVIDAEDLEVYRRDLLRWMMTCREISPRGKVLLLARDVSPRFLAEALRNGADWLLPFTREQEFLRRFVWSMILKHRAERDLFVRRPDRSGPCFDEEILGRTAVMKDLGRLIEKCAPSRANVVIRGESGTGKELVARAIHRLSGRSGSLVVVNCAAMMDNLHQSELFGHEKGAFTDAKARRVGYFEAARGGTLFLDEIGDITPATQIGLLRVIEGKEFFRVGGCEPIRVDVRVVSATHQNLEEKVRAGQFREDLYYRLNGFGLRVPPLRERREDIPLLAEAFLERYAERERKPVVGFTPEAMDLLSCYHWPGNVREMENEIQRILIHVERERFISSDMLSPSINLLKRLTTTGSSAKASLKARTQQVEAFFIKEALKMCYGNRTRAARHLGISREGLHKKMARYSIR